jgi:phytoene dehydrogenase-like protein
VRVVDAVVVGAGHNGLVAANILADAGWDVLVLEEQPEPGGAVRSSAGPAPGFVTDWCSAFYPLTAASRAFGALDLEQDGLRWRHAPNVLAHPLPDGRAAVLSRDLDTTVAGVEELGAGDGAAWRRLWGTWQRLNPALLDALFAPFPPVRAGARLAANLGPSGLLHFARFAVLPARRLAEEEFSGPGSLRAARGPDAGIDRQRDLRLAAVDARPGLRLPGTGRRSGADHRGPGAAAGTQGRPAALRRVGARGRRAAGPRRGGAHRRR